MSIVLRSIIQAEASVSPKILFSFPISEKNHPL